MSHTTWLLVALLSALVWVAAGLVLLLPRKLAQLRKHGYGRTNDELLELAKSGDPDLRTLVRDSRLYLAFGFILFGVLALIYLMFVAKEV